MDSKKVDDVDDEAVNAGVIASTDGSDTVTDDLNKTAVSSGTPTPDKKAGDTLPKPGDVVATDSTAVADPTTGVTSPAANHDHTATVVSAQSVNGRFSKRTILIIFLAVVAVVGLVIWQYLEAGSKPVNTKSTEQVRQLQASAAELKNKGDYRGEAEKIEDYLDSNPPDEFAKVEIIRLGSSYMNTGDYDKAIGLYQTALKKYPDAEMAATRGIAFAYMKRGEKNNSKDDYAKAIEWFEKAIVVEKRIGALEVVSSDESNIRYVKRQLQ